ncbi:TPA: hypothetical protein HA278_03685 [Candidatus Woesearchaeota archaeon]|nr:hypothetical protein [archaeon]HIJ11131.1 hypothetical protein [Candidatus Woesearchaeota archaeon]
MKLYIILLFLLIPIANAHLDAGEDVVKEEYILDFGYSPERLMVGEESHLAVSLFDDAREIVEFDHAWVRISNEDTIFFSSTLYPVIGNAALTYSFPHAGDYDITVRFTKNDTELVQHTFVVHVEREHKWSLLIIAALLFLFAIMVKIKKKKRN